LLATAAEIRFVLVVLVVWLAFVRSAPRLCTKKFKEKRPQPTNEKKNEKINVKTLCLMLGLSEGNAGGAGEMSRW